MKYKGTYFRLFSLLLRKPMKRKFGRKATSESIRNGKAIYRDMVERTEDIGADNPMAGNIYMGYVFMAICRAGKFAVNDFMEVTTEFMHSKIVSKIMGGSDLNNPEEVNRMSVQMHKIAKWADEHPEFKDKTWDFNFDETLHKDGFYYHFTRCPMEKFARENGYLDVLVIGCNIDYLTCEAKQAVLHRDSTLASKGDRCDYWIVGNKIKNPE